MFFVESLHYKYHSNKHPHQWERHCLVRVDNYDNIVFHILHLYGLNMAIIDLYLMLPLIFISCETRLYITKLSFSVTVLLLVFMTNII